MCAVSSVIPRKIREVTGPSSFSDAVVFTTYFNITLTANHIPGACNIKAD